MDLTKLSRIDFYLFSRYRTELMGVAILGVLIAHSFSLGQIPKTNLFLKALDIIPRLAFTEGFLFLSGFGLYYSFLKNDDIKDFYNRRLKRLIIPFIVLSAWYFIYTDLVKSFEPIAFVGHITSLAFWIEGNYNGMWYIALSIILYALFPFFYKHILTNRGGNCCHNSNYRN